MKNKKYTGYIISSVLGEILAVVALVLGNYSIIIIALILPFVFIKIFGGEPDLSSGKIYTNSKNLDLLLEDGFNQANLGRYQEALKIFNKILKIDSKNEEALANKANIYNRLFRSEDAITICNKILAKNSKCISALNYKAVALTNLNQYKKALIVYDKILQIDSRDEVCIENKGRCFYKMYETFNMLDVIPQYSSIDISKINGDDIIGEHKKLFYEKDGKL
ncbi:MAG: tetratricopeptide repeat protein [Patescibacteria group bacterium]